MDVSTLIPQVLELAELTGKEQFTLMDLWRVTDPKPVDDTYYICRYVMAQHPEVFTKVNATRWEEKASHRPKKAKVSAAAAEGAPETAAEAKELKGVVADVAARVQTQAKKQAKTVKEEPVKEETAKEMETRFTEEIKTGLAHLRGAAALVGGEKMVIPEMPRPAAVKKNDNNNHPDLITGDSPMVRRAGRSTG